MRETKRTRPTFSNGGNIHTIGQRGPEYKRQSENGGVCTVLVDGKTYLSLSVGSCSVCRPHDNEPPMEKSEMPKILEDIKIRENKRRKPKKTAN
jgi:hypothetical protein